MSNYLKNKNFIPRSYVKRVEKIKNKGNKRGVIYLVIINLTLLPLTIEIISKKENIVEEENPRIIEEEILTKSIISWINEVDKDVRELLVNDNKGTITVNSIDKLYLLEEKDNISINNIIENEKGDYILEIERNNNNEK